jgi:hypothetical protein
MATPINPGNDRSTNFFSNSTAMRLSLVPGAAGLAKFTNKKLGTGAAAQYNSQVAVSQANGSGPVIAPINAPYSVTQFATGIRTLKMGVKKGIMRRMGK